jgi:hypothetical protein
MEKPIREWIIRLLNARGGFEPLNSLWVVSTYRDEKVLIRGTVDPVTKKFTNLRVLIRMVPLHGENYLSGFGIPKSVDADHTLVYQADNELVQFFRKGRWIKYLERLFQEIEEPQKRLTQLNRQPIDDNDLWINQLELA